MALRQEMISSGELKSSVDKKNDRKYERTYAKLLEKFKASSTQALKVVDKKTDDTADKEYQAILNRHAKWSEKFKNLADDAEFKKFKELSSDDRFEFLTVMINDVHLWGAIAAKLRQSVSSNYPKLIETLDVKQRVELAKSDVKIRGMRILNRYSLTEPQNQELMAFAKVQLKQFLPIVTDEMIDQCVNDKDRDELQFLINTRICGRGLYHSGMLETRETLRKLFYDSSSSLQMLADAFKITLREQEQVLLNNGWLAPIRHREERPEHWSTDLIQTFDGEDTVTFAHRGGYFNCLRFFSGDSTAAYPLTQGGYGIQVLPNRSDSSKEYSDKAQNYFDFPAKATGRIKAKFLDSAEMGAGLRYEYAALASDVQVVRLA